MSDEAETTYPSDAQPLAADALTHLILQYNLQSSGPPITPAVLSDAFLNGGVEGLQHLLNPILAPVGIHIHDMNPPVQYDAFIHSDDDRPWYRGIRLCREILGSGVPHPWEHEDHIAMDLENIIDDDTREELLGKFGDMSANGAAVWGLPPDLTFYEDYRPSHPENYLTRVTTETPVHSSHINGKCYTPGAPLGVPPEVQRNNPFYASATVNVIPDLNTHALYYHSGTTWSDEHFINLAIHLFVSNGPSKSYDILKKDDLGRYVYKPSMGNHLNPNGKCIFVNPLFRPRAPFRAGIMHQGTHANRQMTCIHVNNVWTSNVSDVEKRRTWINNKDFLLSMDAVHCGGGCGALVPDGNFTAAQLAKKRTERLCMFCAENMPIRMASIQGQASNLHFTKERRECSICNASKLYNDYSNRQYYKGDDDRACIECQGNQ